MTSLRGFFETGNSSSRVQLVKTLTKQQQGKVNNIQDKDGKCLTEGEDKRKDGQSTAHNCTLFRTNGPQSVHICQEPIEEEEFPILRQEVESAIKTLKCGKAAGVDYATAELITHGGQLVVEVLHAICNKIWEASGLQHGQNRSSSPYP